MANKWNRKWFRYFDCIDKKTKQQNKIVKKYWENMCSPQIFQRETEMNEKKINNFISHFFCFTISTRPTHANSMYLYSIRAIAKYSYHFYWFLFANFTSATDDIYFLMQFLCSSITQFAARSNVKNYSQAKWRLFAINCPKKNYPFVNEKCILCFGAMRVCLLPPPFTLFVRLGVYECAKFVSIAPANDFTARTIPTAVLTPQLKLCRRRRRIVKKLMRPKAHLQEKDYEIRYLWFVYVYVCVCSPLTDDEAGF